MEIRVRVPARSVTLARPLTSAQRTALPDSAFACPEQRAFPIYDYAHASNAHARWDNPNTRPATKCAGGLRRICEAERRFGIERPSCNV